MVSPYALYLQIWIDCFCKQGTKRGKTILRKQLDALAPQAEMYLKQHKEAEKLEQRIEEAERRVETLQQRDLFDVREQGREREDGGKEKRAGVGS